MILSSFIPPESDATTYRLCIHFQAFALDRIVRQIGRQDNIAEADDIRIRSSFTHIAISPFRVLWLGFELVRLLSLFHEGMNDRVEDFVLSMEVH
ncbi:hypothetical protein CPB84DRAFT_1785678 [Gymnopilus junonius]|uniref:Uncharacterized protein n=1 Tax=Gymnopilus junonius TaxID=109634 RepID=A0A9P5NGD7_GYMJU|nr:hypothetical protein CPB84DRAFT_1785678 [Gymnopilus junonius]